MDTLLQRLVLVLPLAGWLDRLFHKFFAGGLLDPGHLTLRQREIVIYRATALCRSEYERGVHISAFGAHAGFTAAQTASLVHRSPQDDCWMLPPGKHCAPGSAKRSSWKC